jgi:hypothetical protein
MSPLAKPIPFHFQSGMAWIALVSWQPEMKALLLSPAAT